MSGRHHRAPALVADRAWDAHLALHRLFEAHLEALYGSEPWAALVRAIDLREQLFAHIRFEEDRVVPRIADREVRGQVLRDHALLREASKRLEEAALLAGFGRVDELRLRQRLVELDRLLDHHDDREARDVYATLGEALDEAGRGELLAGLAGTSSAEPLAEAVVERVVTHPTVRALAARYRAWLAGEPLPSEVPMPALPAALPATLAKLLARDERAVAALRDAEGVRERARREMLAEVALRSGLAMVVEALTRAS